MQEVQKKPTEDFIVSGKMLGYIHSHKSQKLRLPLVRPSGEWNIVNGTSQDQVDD